MADAYPTKAQCKTFMVVSGSGEDDVIDFLLNGAVAFVERYCGRTFLDVESETISVMPTYPNLVGRGHRTLLLRGYDLFAVTGAGITNGDGETISDYTLLPLDGPPYYKIEIDADAGQYWNRGSSGKEVVTIVCTTGFSDAVPNDIFEAVLDLVLWKYRARTSGAGGPVTTATREGLTIAPAEVPPNIMQTLDYYKRLRI